MYKIYIPNQRTDRHDDEIYHATERVVTLNGIDFFLFNVCIFPLLLAGL